MSRKVIKRVAASMLSVLVFGSQLPSGSACPHDSYFLTKPRVMKIEKDIRLKGIFDIPGLRNALERAMHPRPMRVFPRRVCNCIKPREEICFLKDTIKLVSDNGRVVVKIGAEYFELAYDKLVNKETGEIDEIEIPSCIEKIGSGVFRDILKQANAQGKQIKKGILPECPIMAAEDIFAGVSVDSVVFKSNHPNVLNINIFEGALNIGAVFVPKRFEEKVKKNLKYKDIRVFEDFELKNAFNIDGLKDAIMDALA